MLEDVNLKISQFVDGELSANEALKLLKEMQERPEMDDAFRRYEALSHALRRNVYIAAEEDFVAKVSAKLGDEPVVLRPARRLGQRQARALIAVAASFAVLAIIVAGTLQQRDKPFAAGVEFASRQSVKEVYAASSRPPVTDARFNEYLEAHGATLYAGGYSAPQAYGQVVNYGRK